MTALAWGIAAALIAARVVTGRVRRHREEAAWQRHAGEALAVARDSSASDFARWESSLTGGAR